MTNRALADDVFGAPLLLTEGWRIESSVKVGAVGSELSRAGFDDSSWHRARVPTTVVGALVDDGTLADPHFGSNLRAYPGVGYPLGANFSNLEMPDDSPFRASWWYRTEFALPKSADPARRFWLRFGGINFSANVWMNAKRVAGADDTAGAMRTHELDVTGSVVPGGVNALAIEVFPPQAKDLALTFVDWNPAPPDKLMGIYRDVALVASGPVTLRHPYVKTELTGKGPPAARLSVTVDVRNAAAVPVEASVEGQIGVRRFSQPITLAPGETRTLSFTPQSHPQLVVPNPRLWWPATLGAQELYDLVLRCQVSGRPSDAAQLRFGIRQVRDELTAEGHRLFRINGQRILVRGAGYTPEMLLRPSAERQEAELEYLRDMNLNTVRLEGKIEDDHFLELCDRLGILVLAGWCCCDHWEKWSDWNERDRQIAAESQRSQIRRLRAHPSLLAWMNASDMPPPADVERMYLGILRELEWQNPVVSSAAAKASEVSGPSGVKMLGPYEYVPPIYWYVDRERGGAYGFNTETSPGPAVPPIESLRRMLPPDHLWPIDDEWLFHAGGGVFRSLSLHNAALAARYGPSASVEEYARKAQIMAYETHRAMFEAFGRNKYRATGVIQWMLNNAWPSLIWHLYDFYLRPGGSYFGAKKACEPLHVQYSYDDRGVVVVNGLGRGLAALNVSAVVYDIDSRERYRNAVKLDIAADESKVAFTLPEIAGLGPAYLLALALDDASGRRASTNHYWLSSRPDVLDFEKAEWYVTPVKEHADLTAFDRLPGAEVALVARAEGGGAREGRLSVRLTNASPLLAFGLRLKVVRAADGEELLPVLWEDNYVALAPRETRALGVRFPRAGAQNDPLEVVVEGWNVPVMRASVPR